MIDTRGLSPNQKDAKLKILKKLKKLPSLARVAMLKPEFLGLVVRCKDEPFIKELCEHYLFEGVDRIIVVDDNSDDKSIYREIQSRRVKVLYEKDIIRRNFVDSIYKILRKKFEWLIYVDADEFISSRRDPDLTIKKALQTIFSSVDCVKVPWVMMSCSLREPRPESLRLDLVHRWNHDLRHPNPVHKFRCRYDEIEVKSIFRPKEFKFLGDHCPVGPVREDIRIVDSVTGASGMLSGSYRGLREADIERSILACHHYRIQSVEDCKRKLAGNIWYEKYSLEDLLSSDNAELFDDTLRKKALRQSGMMEPGGEEDSVAPN